MSGDRPAPSSEARVLVGLAEKITTGDSSKSEFKAATATFAQEWASVVKDPAYLAQVKTDMKNYSSGSSNPFLPDMSFIDNPFKIQDSNGATVKSPAETEFFTDSTGDMIGSMVGSNSNMLRAFDDGSVDVLFDKAGQMAITGQEAVTKSGGS